MHILSLSYKYDTTYNTRLYCVNKGSDLFYWTSTQIFAVYIV